MKNFIINLLDLKLEDLKSFDIDDLGDKVIITITLSRTSQKCPSCFRDVSKIKEYKKKTFIHQIINCRDTYIIYNSRRYVCPYCGKTFNEDNPYDKTYSSITNATLISILNEFKHYTATYSSVAKRYGISPTTVVKIVDNHIQIKRHRLQTVICIDEFYFNRHSKYKYAFLIMGFKNKLILDIVESRQEDKLISYFHSIPLEERRKVLYVSMDMYIHYKNIIPVCLPNAVICIDSFHVLKKINDALNSLRKRVMRKYADDKECLEYKLLKKRYKVLLEAEENINDTEYHFDRILGYTTSEAGVLESLLLINSDLRVAYNLKEDYRMFNNIEEKDFNYEQYYHLLNSLIDAFITSNIKEMADVGKTLNNWKVEILNSFIWFDGRRISNGCIEGKNNYIKKILSNANGMQNFARARNRIMYSQNQYETYNLSIGSKNIKKPGKCRNSYKKKK